MHFHIELPVCLKLRGCRARRHGIKWLFSSVAYADAALLEVTIKLFKFEIEGILAVVLLLYDTKILFYSLYQCTAGAFTPDTHLKRCKNASVQCGSFNTCNRKGL